MDKAKQAVSDFMHKSGKHDTTVHENVAPAVTRQTINPERREEITTAVDKEVHQDHYHTSVQPVHDREVLPEQHHHNLGAVEHREHHHGNEADVTRKLEQERARFKDERIQGETTHTQHAAPTVTGQHIHHHVHETIQPVVHKETIEPHVVHTTVPIHEVHHNAPQHHTTSALPAVHMSDFKKQGGVLGGREERYDGFEGEPKAIGKVLGEGHGLGGTSSHDHHHTSGLGSSGLDARDHHHTGTTTGTGPLGSDHSSHHNQGGLGQTTSNTSTGKPSLMQKMNPMTDSNGDGQKGFMK